MVQYFLMSSQRRKSVKKYSFSQDFFGLQKKWRDKEVVSKWMPQTCLRGRISTKPNEKNQNFLFWVLPRRGALLQQKRRKKNCKKFTCKAKRLEL